MFEDHLQLISCLNDEDVADAFRVATDRRHQRNLIRKVSLFSLNTSNSLHYLLPLYRTTCKNIKFAIF